MADQQTIEQRAAEREARKKKNAAARRSYRAKQKAKRGERGTAATAVDATPEAREHGPGRPKERTGKVVSAKPDKTITVRIDMTRRHQVYKKIVRSSTTLHVHDERNDAK